MKRVSIALYILRDMYRMDRFRVLAIGPLGLLAESSRMIGAGLLLQFIGGYATNDGGPALDVFGIDLGLDADASRAWLWLGLLAITAALASGLDYAYIFAQLRLGRRFAYHAAEEALHALLDQPHKAKRATDPGGFVRGSGSILGTIAPAIQALVFGTLMFSMRPGLSIVMTILGLLFLGPLTIALGNRVLGATRRKQSARRPRQDANVAVLSSGPLYAESIRQDAYEQSVAASGNVEIYEAVFAVRANQMLARAAGAAFLGVGALVLAIGLTIVEQPGASDVGSLLAYAIVAQFAFRAVAQIGLNAVQFNRFFPTYESYVEMRQANDADSEPPTDPAHVGQVWLVTQRRLPEAWVLTDWLEAIDVAPTTRTAVALGPDDLPNGRARDMIGGGQAMNDDDRAHCEEFVATALGRPLRDDDLDSRVHDLSERGSTPEAKRAAIALSAVVPQHEPLLLICPTKLITNLRRNTQQAALEELRRHHLVLVGRPRASLVELVDKVIDGDQLPSFDDREEEDDAA